MSHPLKIVAMETGTSCENGLNLVCAAGWGVWWNPLDSGTYTV